MDKSSANFWRGLKPGDQVVLTDVQSVEEGMAKGLGTGGLHHQIKKVTTIKEMNGLCEWRLLKLDSEDDLILMVKIVDEEIDLRVYAPVGDVDIGDRQDMIDDDCLWLFEEPDDPEGFEVTELKYSAELGQFVDIDGEEKEIFYARKRQGELYGRVEVQPAESGVENQIATVVEYSTGEDVPNTEIFLLETGTVGNIVIEYDEEEDEETTVETEVLSESRGGLIELFIGASVRPSEVDVLTTKES